MNLRPGEVEVVVLLDNVVINGPDHRSLGILSAGDHVLTAEGAYAEGLVQSGIVCYASDFTGARVDEGAQSLADLDAQISAAEQDWKSEPKETSPTAKAPRRAQPTRQAASTPKARGGRARK